jgi:hypothetical protein
MRGSVGLEQPDTAFRPRLERAATAPDSIRRGRPRWRKFAALIGAVPRGHPDIRRDEGGDEMASR